ncbi:MAG: alkaline phosphatase [Planctomycetota bacterium]|nr:alkaline phosphatase [Planctomycetota bacterium]
MNYRNYSLALTALSLLGCSNLAAQEKKAEKVVEKVDSPKIPTPEEMASFDRIARLQAEAIASRTASWGHWGNRPSSYSAWTNHSNRLIPVYVFGGSFDSYMGSGSIYRDSARLEGLFGRMPTNTVRADAPYADQTDVYRLQRTATETLGKKYVFLVVFDGMDWQTTQAAAIYKSNKVGYTEGKGTGLLFQDYSKCKTDFGYVVTSPYGDEVETDVDAQLNTKPVTKFGGYDSRLAGSFPWQTELDTEYPIGRSKISEHAYTDSSSSATSLTAGIKTINGALNVDYKLNPVETIGQWLQRTKGFAVGTVTSVPISHATPAAAYAHNVSRDDYQDLTRDMLGLPSVSHRSTPLPGLDVVLGGGHGEETVDGKGQGQNFIAGNRYLADEDRKLVDVSTGNPSAKYVVAQRTPGAKGAVLLAEATKKAVANKRRLLGFFGVKKGHLPFRTADGDYKPVLDVKDAEVYSPADLDENPTLAEMTQAAIDVLQEDKDGFWLMVEAGDVDWANHSNNIDNSIGAVLSGELALEKIFGWIEARNAWEESLVIVTSDHGHYLHLLQPEVLTSK